MNLFSIRKYKDELPLNTINKIRNILNDLGILAVEVGWQNSAKEFYSVNLMIENTNLTSNGKGTTYEYALASGYGELMERLQNQAPFRLSMDLNPEALEYKGFYYAPDEKYISMEDLINTNDDWTKKQISLIKPEVDKYELLKKWQLISYEDVPVDFVALPYLNLSNNKLSYIPIKMVSKMYMSNGMCAGNTTEEALVQGLSEILERYVNKEIVKERISPPTIPREYIRNFPRIEAMITRLELSGNFNVIIKDCSLGQGYPVVAVFFINKDEQTYFLKFGAHPIFEIAVERTLTELLQGQDVRNMKGVKEFSYKNDIDDEFQNIMGILVTGSGYYPTEIFSQKFSYEFKKFKDLQAANNKELLIYLVNLLKKNGYDVFIRNVSYLGFPSFHIIVPGLSEIEEIDDIKPLDEYTKYNKIKKYVRNLDNVSKQEVEELISLLNNTNYGSEASIIQLLNLPIKHPFPWYYMNINLFITTLYYKKGDFKNAYESFNKYLKYIQPNSYNKGIFTYYKCVRDYIGTRIEDLEENDVINVLKTFYPLDMINAVLNEFKNPEQIFNLYGQLNCWNCNKCAFKTHCSYASVEKVYKALKDRYASSNINQIDLKKLLSI